jgi:hypothetical protein
MAMYDKEKEAWCLHYTNCLRTMQLRKFDEITANIMEYMDKYVKYTPEELAA